MFISDFAIKRPIVTTVTMIALVVFGIFALAMLQTDEFPDVQNPVVVVSIPNKGGRLVAGLFAEGRVARQTKRALVVPATAVNTSSKEPWVMRIKDGKAEKVTVALGLRDAQTERVELASGVQAGDQLLVGASQALTPGTPVKVRETTQSGTE